AKTGKASFKPFLTEAEPPVGGCGAARKCVAGSGIRCTDPEGRAMQSNNPLVSGDFGHIASVKHRPRGGGEDFVSHGVVRHGEGIMRKGWGTNVLGVRPPPCPGMRH